MAHHNSVRSAYANGPSPLYGSHLIVFQHDEVILEVPIGVSHDAAMRASEIMVEEEMVFCVDLVKACKAPPALMTKWLKSAEPAYKNASGKCKVNDPGARLVPWDLQ